MRELSGDEVLVLCDWLEENPEKVLGTEGTPISVTLEHLVYLLRLNVKERTDTPPGNNFTFYVWKIMHYYGVGWVQPRFLVEEGVAPL